MSRITDCKIFINALDSYKGRKEELKRGIKDTKSEIKELKGNIKSIEGEIKRLKKNISVRKEELGEVKDEMANAGYEIYSARAALLIDAIIAGVRFSVSYGKIGKNKEGYRLHSKDERVVLEDESGYKVTESGLFIAFGDVMEDLSCGLYGLVEKIYTQDDFEELEKEVNSFYGSLPAYYNKDAYKESHGFTGYETDGFSNIIRNNDGSEQAALAEFLVIAKGYCFDKAISDENYREDMSFIFRVYERQGLYVPHYLGYDAGDCYVEQRFREKDYKEWSENNPGKCMDDNPYFKEKAK